MEMAQVLSPVKKKKIWMHQAPSKQRGKDFNSIKGVAFITSWIIQAHTLSLCLPLSLCYTLNNYLSGRWPRCGAVRLILSVCARGGWYRVWVLSGTVLLLTTASLTHTRF